MWHHDAMLLLLVLACGSSTQEPAAPPAVTAAAATCTTGQACAEACTADEALACNLLGLWTHDGLLGTVRSPEGAATLYRKACRLGAGIGCYNISHMRRTGEAGPEDEADAAALMEEARRLYRASCDAGGLTWCTNLAGLMQRGELGSKDPRGARRLLQTTCDRAHEAEGQGTIACVELALYYLSGTGGRKDPDRAEALLLDACDAGSAEGCNTLGERVRERGGDASAVFRRACDSGVAVACRNLARLVPERDAALALLEKACDAPNDLDGVSCVMAAELLLEKPGSEGLAVDRLVRACSVGLASACASAARLGVQHALLDQTKAGDLRARGCSLGDQSQCAAR